MNMYSMRKILRIVLLFSSLITILGCKEDINNPTNNELIFSNFNAKNVNILDTVFIIGKYFHPDSIKSINIDSIQCKSKILNDTSAYFIVPAVESGKYTVSILTNTKKYTHKESISINNLKPKELEIYKIIEDTLFANKVFHISGKGFLKHSIQSIKFDNYSVYVFDISLINDSLIKVTTPDLSDALYEIKIIFSDTNYMKSFHRILINSPIRKILTRISNYELEEYKLKFNVHSISSGYYGNSDRYFDQLIDFKRTTKLYFNWMYYIDSSINNTLKFVGPRSDVYSTIQFQYNQDNNKITLFANLVMNVDYGYTIYHFTCNNVEFNKIDEQIYEFACYGKELTQCFMDINYQTYTRYGQGSNIYKSYDYCKIIETYDDSYIKFRFYVSKS